MKTINFATGNLNKLRELKQILEPEIKVNHIKISYPEFRSDDNQEVARMSAEMISKKLNLAVVVEDSGFFIDALNGFPGIVSAYVHKRIGLEGILKLMKGVKNRKCEYKSAVAYCEPGRSAVSFLGTEKGEIAFKPRGKNGFGHDPIFIPEGSKRTYGEMKNAEELKKFRRNSVLKLKRYLIRNKILKYSKRH